MSIFDHRRKKKKVQESRMSNAFVGLKPQPNNQEEFSKEFQPTQGSPETSPAKKQEEIANELAPSKNQPAKHDHGANPKS